MPNGLRAVRRTELMPCDFASRKATAQHVEGSEGGGARLGSPGRARREGGKAGRGLASVLRDPEARDPAWGEAGHAEQWAKGDRRRGEGESDLVSHGRGRTGKTRSTRKSQWCCAVMDCGSAN